MIKNKLFRLSFICFLILSIFSFAGCDGYASVKMEENGGVSFGFSGDIGNGFVEMMDAVGQDAVIDEKGIYEALVQSGFSNVKVASQNRNIVISFKDENCESFLFQSGIVSVKNGMPKVSLTPEKFCYLYDSSGEDIQMLLDLFLSPVLNDEILSEEEYIDTINVTYGEDVGEEINNSAVHFTITDKIGKKKTKKVFAKSILCGSSFSL